MSKEPTENVILCARHRYYGRGAFDPTNLDRVPEYWKTWAGPVEAIGTRIVLMTNEGKEGPWTDAPKITSDLDEAIGFLDHILPGHIFNLYRDAAPPAAIHYGAQVARDHGLWKAPSFDWSPARALVLATMAELEEKKNMIDFDTMADRFTNLVRHAGNWKHNYTGAAYRTRIRAAIVDLKTAIREAEAHHEIGDAGDPNADIPVDSQHL